MSHEPSEREMLERLVDAARTAADRVQDMCRAHMTGVPVLPFTMVSLRRHLNDARGCAHQLGHAQHNPHFFTVRDQLEDIAKTIGRIGVSPASGFILAQLGKALDMLWRETQRMATSKPMARQDVLAELDLRQLAVAGNG